jgi:hypothetical protein
MNITYTETLSAISDEEYHDPKYWSKRCEIPVGTIKPFYEYVNGIPPEDIIRIPFDPIDQATTGRAALNVLCLGGSGDGKSLLLKLWWYVLHNAGYHVGYIDPKSTDSGRARLAWQLNAMRLPPKMAPDVIQIEHFIPMWATKNFEHLAHNFRIYSNRLKNLSDRDMWRGLGMTINGASPVTRFINNSKKTIDIDDLKRFLFSLKRNELPINTFDSCLRVLNNLEYFHMVDTDVPELEMMEEWRRGNSICISYNNCDPINMTYDIGLRIYQSAQFYRDPRYNNRNPIMWILDDGYYYANDLGKSFNFALEQIKHIGYNYRSLGVYNILAIQSVNAMDDKVAETYRIKIISPKFEAVDSLAKIGVPNEAIMILRGAPGYKPLQVNSKYHVNEWLLIDENKKVTRFYPFMPPVNHFQEVYFTRDAK